MKQARHRAAVLGKPVGHSLSPVIHNAGYAAAGLTDWHYTAHECAEPELAGFLADLDSRWTGLSLTMPLKDVALTVADEVSPLATTLRAANTLYRRGDRWLAENTDAPGIVDALRWAGVSRVDRTAVLGAGGTARAALAAAADMGSGEVAVYARRREVIDELRPVADLVGVRVLVRPWSDAAQALRHADLVLSTMPSGVADHLAGSVPRRPELTVFEVLYHPWPTPLAAAALAAGCAVVGGVELLLAQ
ncbi:MAG TPA: shikimate dehydrogenase, partial [Micromonosporaceae bacterium]|nr:shikimate dehydrogenase [Micromonosporaceae bacterium]